MSKTLRQLARELALPAALINLPALDANAAQLFAVARAGGKRLRIATKSLRCPALIERLVASGGADAGGLMTYHAAETALLASRGLLDLLLAYPTVHPHDLEQLAQAASVCARGGGRLSVVIDAPEHLAALESAAARGGAIGVVVETDLALRPLGARGPVIGVRRSPLRTPADVVELLRRLPEFPHLTLQGVMGYEAHIAGLPDRAGGPAGTALRRAMKQLARPAVGKARRELADALAAAGLRLTLWNGGGTGSLTLASQDALLTEVTAGSGFVASHLFDRYDGLALAPAIFFALQVVRRAAPHVVTCHGGGWIASGAPDRDRLPQPVDPPGLSLLDLEGAGEVQTPLREPAGVHLAIGEPVLFRPAKAGELAEHVTHYHLVDASGHVTRAPTYRGLGAAFV